MPDYRAYLVDEDDSFCDVVKMDCVDDVEAIEKTRPLAGKFMPWSFGSLTGR